MTFIEASLVINVEAKVCFTNCHSFRFTLATLEMQSMGQGMKRIKGIKTGRFVAMNANGDLYSTVRCHFKESYF